jgi:hypothetical protein
MADEAEGLPEYTGKHEERLPIRGIVNSLALDQHRLGCGNLTADECRELDKCAVAIAKELMQSRYSRERLRGAKLWREIKDAIRRTQDLLLKHGQVGIEAVTAERIQQMRLEAAQASDRPTPEQTGKHLREIMQVLSEASKEDGS